MSEAGNNEKFNYIHAFPEPLKTLNFSLRSLTECLTDGLIVLDTNVLLLPFKTGPHALDEIEKALEHLKSEKRLFIPEHALREYLANRPNKIREFYDQLSKRRNKDYSIPAVGKLIEKVGSFSRLDEAEKRLKEDVEKLRSAIAEAMDEVRQWTINDPVSKMYQKVLTEDLVLSLADGLDKLEKEHKDRNAKALPPGYKDGSKSTNSIGDFLIWKAILELGKLNKNRNLVFVSGEEKPDWVYRSSAEVLYAREELIEEYRQVSDGGSFHLVDFATLLRHLKTSEQAVAEVRVAEVNTAKTSPILTPEMLESMRNWGDFSGKARKAVDEWIYETMSENGLTFAPGGTDFDYIGFAEPSRIEYWVDCNRIIGSEKFSDHIAAKMPRYKSLYAGGPMKAEASAVLLIVLFICVNKEEAAYIAASEREDFWPDWLKIQSGYLKGEYYKKVGNLF